MVQEEARTRQEVEATGHENLEIVNFPDENLIGIGKGGTHSIEDPLQLLETGREHLRGRTIVTPAILEILLVGIST